MFAQIGERARDTSADVLISSELLSWYDVGTFVDSLLQHLGDGPWQPEILLVCREHFEIVASTYNQWVRDGNVRERAEPDAFLRTESTEFSYASIRQNLCANGIAITALNYHPAEDFVPRFLRHIGLSADHPISNDRRNPSIGRKALVATFAANHVAQTTEDRNRYFAALGKMRGFFSPSEFIFGREAAETADVLFREDRRFLSDEFGLTLPAFNPAARQNMFFVDDAELDEITEATRDLGDAGEAIVDFARRYTRVRR
ncbi:MAG TPA: hypothetical protein VGQ90_02025 [Stellaceae bacterium]|jgi:hypothetical protein|nr:hypothetical protein [Stellaceae bacterium]